MMKQARVIYYLCRGGALEHPHLIDVGYSEDSGLLLRDVKRRLVAIRGKGLPDLFSWSYKTRYRNDFIWHDVSDNDLILPVSDAEYIMKGSEIVEGESLLHHCECETEIQCKAMLKDRCCLTRSPLYCFEAAVAGTEECIIQTTNHSAEMKRAATTTTKSTEPSSVIFPRPVSPFQQCRGDKPLPCVHRKVDFVAPTPRAEKTPPRKCMSSVPAPVSGENVVSSKEDSNAPRGSKKTSSSSLIFRQMLPCADIGTKTQQQNGLFQGQKHIFAGRESNGTSWKQGSSKALKKGGKLVSLSADNGTNLSEGRHSHDIKSSLDFVRGSNKFQDESLQRFTTSTLTRYKPRHSFSKRTELSSDYLDSYDLYWRAEKVKEMDNELVMPRQSNASRISLESQFYEVDCKSKSTPDNDGVTLRAQDHQQKEASVFVTLNQKHLDESPRVSVSSQIISKLVLESKANEERNNSGSSKPPWWEDARTPGREASDHERLRKNKLDWEKNLQDAVDMIIRPTQKVLHC